jgi:hypothetical protein
MVNPPTRPYTEEELKEALKLLSGKKSRNNCASTVPPKPSARPIEIKIETPILFENIPPVVIENNVTEMKKSVSAESLVTKCEKPANNGNVNTNTSKSKTFFKSYGIWITLGSIVLIVGAYFYWDYKRPKKEKKNPK